MGKVGVFIIDSSSGGYCTISFDGGGRIVIRHSEGGLKGGLLTVDAERVMGLTLDRIFTCDLDSARGKAALGQLTSGALEGSVDATPLGALVKYVRDCRSIAEVERRCAALISGPLAGR